MEVKKFRINQTVYFLTMVRQPNNNWSVSVSVEGQAAQQPLTCELVTWAPDKKQLVFKVNQQVISVEVAGTTENGGHIFNLAHHGKQIQVDPVTTMAPAGMISTAGTVFTPAYREKVDGHSDDPGAFTSPLAGRVSKVLVVERQEVAKNQPLVVVESMKMENELCAPYAAFIKTLSILEGNVVKTNQVLLSLERKKGECDATTEGCKQ